MRVKPQIGSDFYFHPTKHADYMGSSLKLTGDQVYIDLLPIKR